MKVRLLSASISGVVAIALLQTVVVGPAEAADDDAAARAKFIVKAESFLDDMGVAPGSPEVAAVPLAPAHAEAESGKSLDRLPGASWRDVDVAGTGTVVPGVSWRKVPGTPVEVRQSVLDASSQVPVQVSTRWAPELGTGVVAVEVSSVPADVEETVPDGGAEGAVAVVPGVDVRVSLGEAATAFGGVWTDSLEVTELGADLCADGLGGCELPDAAAEVEVPESVGQDRPGVAAFEVAPSTAAVDESGVAEGSSATAEDPASVESQATSMVFAVAGSEDAYKANPLPVSAGWQVGEGSGEFSYAYDFDLPDPQLTGAPSLALGYSSGSVDAMTLNANGQGAAEGLGWSMAPGFVTRSYASCAADGEDAEDLCWKTNGGHLVEDLRLVLNGQSSELIPVEGQPDEFRLRIDPGWRVTRLQGGVATSQLAPSGSDNDGERFVVETPDGTTYTFGSSAGSDSVWTVPVFGNNADEPCHDGAFATSWCDQGWRWNLDEVTDRHGNRVVYDYAAETNHYKRGPGQVLTPYDRAGRLTSVRYAFDGGVARAEATVGSVQRCTAAKADDSVQCPAPLADPQAFPDVPTTLICGSEGACANNSPSFFSTFRYSKVTTQVRPSGQGDRIVDVYQLDHSFPGTDGGVVEPHLWLDSVKREGRNGQGAEAMPKVAFNWILDQNRVVVPEGQRSLNKPRIESILTEYGGRIQVSYGQAGDDTPNIPGDDGAPGNHRCTGDEVNAGGLARWEMKQDCFAQRFNGQWDWFHKFLVRRVALTDKALGYENPPHFPGKGTEGGTSVLGEWQVTDYDYTGAPAWRFSNNLNAGVDDETWDDWRGYETTTLTSQESNQRHLTDRSLSVSKVTRFRGMHNSRLNPAGDTVDARLDTIEFTLAENEPLDQYWLADRVAESQTLTGTKDYFSATNAPQSTSPIERTYNEFDSFQTASPASTAPRVAHLVYPKLTRTHTRLVGTGNDRTRTVTYTVADGGAQHRGVTAGAVTSVIDDGQGLAPICSTSTWKTSDELWLRVPGRAQLWDDACESGTLTKQTDLLYDNEVTGTNPPVTIGNLVREDVKLNATETARSAFVYDGLGRQTRYTNPRGHASTTGYTTPGGARDVVSATVATNALGHVSTTTLDPGRGQATRVVDPNNAATTLTHDGLGRLTTVRYPGNTGTTPSVQITYRNLRDANQAPVVPRVTTEVQREGNTVDRVWAFYDGWGRPIETQVPQGDGKDSTGAVSATNPGRVVAVTGYDSLGRARYSMPAVPNGTTPDNGVELLNPNPATVANVRDTVFDGAGRPVRVKRAVPYGFRNVVTDYFGDRILTKPPRGGWTRTEINGRGQTTRVAQYSSASEATLGQAARYAYTAAGQLKTIHSAIGGTTESAWTYTYDLAGRRISASDPDTGTSTTGYDLNGNATLNTDAAARSFGTTYDALDRPTQVAAGGQVATEWGYDTGVSNSIGRTVFSRTHTRTDGTDRIFTRRVGGYDPRGNATSTSIEYPAALVGGAGYGSSTISHTYNAADMPVTSNHGAVANVPAVNLTHTYTPHVPLIEGTYNGDRVLGWSDYQNDNKLSGTVAGLFVPMAGTANGYEPETGRLATQSHASRWSYYDFVLGWDDTDNLTQIHLAATNTPASPNTVLYEAQCNSYDGLNRLTAAKSRLPGEDGICSATAPSSENLLLVNDLNYSYTSDRLTSESDRYYIKKYNRWVITTREWKYQRPGSPHSATSLTSKVDFGAASTVATLTYDGTGNVTKSQRTGLPTIDYTYDAQGRIATMTSGGSTRYRAYDADGGLLAEYGGGTATLTLDDVTISDTPSTAPTAVRTHTHAGQPVASLAGTSWTYLMADQQGSIRLTTAEDIPALGTRSHEVYSNYEPFGQRLGGTPAPGDRGYLNKRALAGIDPNTIQLDHRIYPSDLNVLLNPDPLLDPYDPQTLNPYSYARNNPTSLSDPSGLCPEETCGAPTAGERGNEPGSYVPPVLDPPVPIPVAPEASSPWSPLDDFGSSFGDLLQGVGQGMAASPMGGAAIPPPVWQGASDEATAEQLAATEELAVTSALMALMIVASRGGLARPGSGMPRSATTGARALPASVKVPLGNSKYGLEHILRRHSFNSLTTTPASKFSSGMGHIEIRQAIKDAVARGGNWGVEGSSRVLDTSLGRTIGTDLAGNSTSGIRIVTDDIGTVITSYPIPWP